MARAFSALAEFLAVLSLIAGGCVLTGLATFL
jgi:hypothetical protein